MVHIPDGGVSLCDLRILPIELRPLSPITVGLRRGILLDTLPYVPGSTLMGATLAVIYRSLSPDDRRQFHDRFWSEETFMAFSPLVKGTWGEGVRFDVFERFVWEALWTPRLEAWHRVALRRDSGSAQPEYLWVERGLRRFVSDGLPLIGFITFRAGSGTEEDLIKLVERVLREAHALKLGRRGKFSLVDGKVLPPISAKEFTRLLLDDLLCRPPKRLLVYTPVPVGLEDKMSIEGYRQTVRLYSLWSAVVRGPYFSEGEGESIVERDYESNPSPKRRSAQVFTGRLVRDGKRINPEEIALYAVAGISWVPGVDKALGRFGLGFLVREGGDHGR